MAKLNIGAGRRSGQSEADGSKHGREATPTWSVEVKRSMKAEQEIGIVSEEKRCVEQSGE